MAPELFRPFYDPDNSVICVEGKTTVSDINTRSKPDGLYFPLYLDEGLSIAHQVQTQAYTSRSFRFGAFADNIFGMNFTVQGRKIKAGGRTIKNVTGYDLVRFLGNSPGQFGSIETLVLKLRPLPAGYSRWRLLGEPKRILQFQSAFLRDTWSHLATIFDFEILEEGIRLYIEFPVLSEQERGLLSDWISKAAAASGLEAGEVKHLPVNREKPRARVKTPLSSAVAEARNLVLEFPGRVYGYLGNGFFAYYPDNESTGLLEYLSQVDSRLSPDGGGVSARGVSRSRHPKTLEWETELKEKWNAG